MFDEGLVRARRALHALVTGHGSIDQSRDADRLFAGDYSTSTTAGEEFKGSRLGLGVMRDLDGEVVSVDGRTWCIPADGRPRRVGDDEGVAFAMAAYGGRRHDVALPPGTDFSGITHALDAYLDATAHHEPNLICAIELVGEFHDVLLRTVAPVDYVGEPLAEVIEHERRFSFEAWQGTVVGFRFPDEVDGTRIPGLHLHAISTDESSGGHVRQLRVAQVTAALWVDEVHSPIGVQ